jgi:hypothetical protein
MSPYNLYHTVESIFFATNQAQGACLRQYNAFLSLQIYPESYETPGGGVI